MKPYSFQSHLFKFTLKISVTLVAIGLIAALVPTIGLMLGILQPANYSERLVAEAKETIQLAKSVTPEMIPGGVHYVVLRKDHLEVVSGNMSQSEIKKARKYIDGTHLSGLGNDVYTPIERSDEYVVIHYRLAVQFTSPILHKLIPFPAVVYAVLAIACFFGALYANIQQFAKLMRAEFSKLNVITEQIKTEELDFVVGASAITELQQVMDSLESLRTALQQSIQAQLVQERSKQEQISALAHDIKIPITIIRGNAELLSLSSQKEAQGEFTQEIITASQQVEHYIKLLVQMSQSEERFSQQLQLEPIQDFVLAIQKDTEAIALNRGVSFILDNRIPLQSTWEVDDHLMQRALMNILMNGLDFTPAGLSLTLTAYLEGDMVCLEIVDEGPGFTEEALQRGKDMFYSGDKSRSNTGHYGIGLPFANKVIQIHKGTLQLHNDLNTGGGHVKIMVPCRT